MSFRFFIKFSSQKYNDDKLNRPYLQLEYFLSQFSLLRDFSKPDTKKRQLIRKGEREKEYRKALSIQ